MKELPELPRINRQREAKFGLSFRTWIEANPQFACTVELKQTTSYSLAFSAVSAEQIAYGLKIKSDTGVLIRVQGSNGEPDYIWCRNMPAWIVIKYPQCFCIIDVQVFVNEKCKRRSSGLSQARAVEISHKTVWGYPHYDY